MPYLVDVNCALANVELAIVLVLAALNLQESSVLVLVALTTLVASEHSPGIKPVEGKYNQITHFLYEAVLSNFNYLNVGENIYLIMGNEQETCWLPHAVTISHFLLYGFQLAIACARSSLYWFVSQYF